LLSPTPLKDIPEEASGDITNSSFRGAKKKKKKKKGTMDISINEPEEAKNEYVMQEEDHYKNVGMTNAKMGRMESEKFGLY
jgi:hypothetical protein